MKIAIISSVCRPVLDGVTTSLHHRLENLSKLKHHVLVMCPDYKLLALMYPGYKEWTGGIFPGVRVVSVPSEPINYERNMSRKANPVIQAELVAFQPDIIHVDEPERISISTWNAPGVAYARDKHIPCVAFYRTNFIDYIDDYFPRFLVPILRWLAGLIIRSVYLSYDVTLVSNVVAEGRVRKIGVYNAVSGRFLGVSINDATQQLQTFQPNFFQNDYDSPQLDGKVVLAFVGRLSPDKGWHFILDAFEHLAKTQDNNYWFDQISVVVAGDGELRDEIQESFHKLGLPAAILGRVLPENIPTLLTHADICVTGSEKETFGLTLLECFAASKPVIAPRAGGVTYSIRNEENGLLFDPGNLDDFIKSLGTLVTDISLREELGRKGADDSKNFGLSTVTTNLVDTWQAQIDRHHQHNPTAVLPASIFTLANIHQNMTGFWGVPDATHQFCEPHYAVTPYVAEFCNSLSSFVYVFVARMAYTRIQQQYDIEWMKLACFWLAVIGIGSIVFHGTMRLPMQLLCEGPMFFFLLILSVWKMDKLPLTKPSSNLYQVMLIGFAIGLLLLYLIVGNYLLFFYGFLVLVVLEALFDIIAAMHFWNVCDKRSGIMAVLGFVSAVVFWKAEDTYCETVPSVWPCHAIWHILSCIAAYYIILFNVSLVPIREKFDSKGAFSLLPSWVAVKAKKKSRTY